MIFQTSPKQCGEDQITAAPPYLLEQFALVEDYHTMSTLVEKGISGGPDAWRTLHMLTCEGHNSWMAENLLQKRMWVDVNDYDALHACIQNNAVDVAKLLLDGGMNFEEYRQERPHSGSEETIRALEEYWKELQEQHQTQADEQESAQPEIGGMALG